MLEAAAKARYGVITMENHSVDGGLGTAVAEVTAEAGITRRLTRVGIPVTYIHGVRKQYQMREYDLDALALVTQTEKVIGAPFGITEEDLAAAAYRPISARANRKPCSPGIIVLKREGA